MRKEIQDLRTNARIFQLSKCTACTFTLDLPAVHFMCMHSFHQRCLGDNEKECPECAPEYRSVLEMKRNLEQNSKDQDQFFQQVKSSKDGFSVIAEYFGKGIISKTSNGPQAVSDLAALLPAVVSKSSPYRFIAFWKSLWCSPEMDISEWLIIIVSSKLPSSPCYMSGKCAGHAMPVTAASRPGKEDTARAQALQRGFCYDDMAVSFCHCSSESTS
ncbi:Vacuolar protein-sorting-associated protein 11-like [Vitis vinifera]|uniref:Vacuolar protein-sorting-associated protein 11-like n=1 Tax=Vitis vinifera TaxID=29760 RepID=A0A438IE99_VITVI|nr:Vacuolar protein-sorting-associated protein 11-like [Vitis vinifera]